MPTVTTQDITTFRSALADFPEILEVLDLIEEFDGDLEEAAGLILIEAGGEGFSRGTGSELLKKLAQKCRRIICKEEFKNITLGVGSSVLPELVSEIMLYLEQNGMVTKLATVIVLYVLKQGINQFCQEREKSN